MMAMIRFYDLTNLFPERGEELLHEFVLSGLRNDHMELVSSARLASTALVLKTLRRV